MEDFICSDCGATFERALRWCSHCGAPMDFTGEAKTLVHCHCGQLASWIKIDEVGNATLRDPGVEQPGPYEAQQCAKCGASLEALWIALRSRALARTNGSTQNVFSRVLALAALAGGFGALLGTKFFDVSSATRAMGGGIGFLLCAGVVVVVGNQLPGALSFWWGHGHGRCLCGQWLREGDRVDGFVNPETPDDEDAWVEIWKCPACGALLRSEVVFGSFV